MLGKNIGKNTARLAIHAVSAVVGAATDAVVTIAAVAAKQHLVLGLQWSYSTSPTGGRLLITNGATTIVDLDITGSGPGGFNFALPGSTNSAVVVTLKSGTGSCVGKLAVQYVTERADTE